MALQDTIANAIRAASNSTVGGEITIVRQKQMGDTVENYDPETGKLLTVETKITVKAISFSAVRSDEVQNADKNELTVILPVLKDFKLQRDDEVIIQKKKYAIIQINDIVAGTGIGGHKLLLRG